MEALATLLLFLRGCDTLHLTPKVIPYLPQTTQQRLSNTAENVILRLVVDVAIWSAGGLHET